jgi:hypothetical protein
VPDRQGLTGRLVAALAVSGSLGSGRCTMPVTRDLNMAPRLPRRCATDIYLWAHVGHRPGSVEVFFDHLSGHGGRRRGCTETDRSKWPVSTAAGPHLSQWIGTSGPSDHGGAIMRASCGSNACGDGRRHFGMLRIELRKRTVSGTS